MCPRAQALRLTANTAAKRSAPARRSIRDPLRGAKLLVARIAPTLLPGHYTPPLAALPGPSDQRMYAADESGESEESASDTAGIARESVLTGKRAIICEDEGINQLQLRKAMARAGVVVAGTAADGQSGVEIALAERPDFIVMDIRMPIMDGIEATRRILQNIDTCVIILTAFSDEDYKEQAFEAGACGYIVKPVTGETLIPQLQRIWKEFVERTGR